MDGHLFKEIILTEGAKMIGVPIVENKFMVEYYTGPSGKKVPIFTDIDDDEIDSLTGTNLLISLGLGELVEGMFPNMVEDEKATPK